MSLSQEILQRPISDLPLRPCAVVGPQTTVRQTLARMRRERVGAAVVVNGGGRAIGMFDEKMLIRLLASDPADLELPIAVKMSRQLLRVAGSNSIATLLAAMQQQRLRWVCVVDNQGQPLALTGFRGVIDYVVDYFARQVRVQPITEKPPLTREGA